MPTLLWSAGLLHLVRLEVTFLECTRGRAFWLQASLPTLRPGVSAPLAIGLALVHLHDASQGLGEDSHGKHAVMQKCCPPALKAKAHSIAGLLAHAYKIHPTWWHTSGSCARLSTLPTVMSRMQD